MKSILAMTPSEAIEKQNNMTTDQRNFVAVRCSIAWYEKDRMKYKYRKAESEEPRES